MSWAIRRLLLPLLIGGIFCTTFLYGLLWWAGSAVGTFRLHDFAIIGLVVALFEAVGLSLLIPIALLVGRLSLPSAAYPIIIILAGTMLGTALMLPLSDPPFQDAELFATCGGVSAAIWFLFNRPLASKARGR